MAGSSSTTPRERLTEVLPVLWWLPLFRGIMLLILGAYALFRPGMTMAVLTQIIGFFVVANGVLSIISGILGQVRSRVWGIVRGVLEILVGAFVVANPLIVAGITATVLIYTLAFSAILSGVLEILVAIQNRKQIEGEAWLIIAGVLMVLFGLVLLMAPLAFGLFIVRVLGAFAIFSGVSLIVIAFRLRGLVKSIK